MTTASKKGPLLSWNSVDMTDGLQIVTTILVRDRYRTERNYFLVRILILVGLLTLASFEVTSTLALRPSETRYIPVERDSSYTQYVPLDQANADDADVLAWAQRAVEVAYRIDFANYRLQLQRTQLNMTQGGWENFRDALIDSANIKAIKDQKLVSTPRVTGAPELVKKGPFNGRYAWKVMMPIHVAYASSKVVMTQDLMVTVVVVRCPEYLNPAGLAIAQIIGR